MYIDRNPTTTETIISRKSITLAVDKVEEVTILEGIVQEEGWGDYNDTYDNRNIPGFKRVIVKIRQVEKSIGGLVYFVKEEIFEGIFAIVTINRDMLWIKLKKVVFDG